jgi:hypothetical protein
MGCRDKICVHYQGNLWSGGQTKNIIIPCILVLPRLIMLKTAWTVVQSEMTMLGPGPWLQVPRPGKSEAEVARPSHWEHRSAARP